jgi:hypothetical protein
VTLFSLKLVTHIVVPSNAINPAFKDAKLKLTVTARSVAVRLRELE